MKNWYGLSKVERSFQDKISKVVYNKNRRLMKK